MPACSSTTVWIERDMRSGSHYSYPRGGLCQYLSRLALTRALGRRDISPLTLITTVHINLYCACHPTGCTICFYVDYSQHSRKKGESQTNRCSCLVLQLTLIQASGIRRQSDCFFSRRNTCITLSTGYRERREGSAAAAAPCAANRSSRPPLLSFDIVCCFP